MATRILPKQLNDQALKNLDDKKPKEEILMPSQMEM